MTTYEIYIKNPNKNPTYTHVENVTNQSKRNQIIKDLRAKGHNVTVIERYSNGATCRCEYNA